MAGHLGRREVRPLTEEGSCHERAWSCCPRCGPSELQTFFASGIIRDITFTGRDAQGGPVKVLVRIPLNSSVGKRE